MYGGIDERPRGVFMSHCCLFPRHVVEGISVRKRVRGLPEMSGRKGIDLVGCLMFVRLAAHVRHVGIDTSEQALVVGRTMRRFDERPHGFHLFALFA